jgi:hypothetical protein
MPHLRGHANLYLHSQEDVARANKLAYRKFGHIFDTMSDILNNTPRHHEEPKLIVRRASHAPVWSVWATLEGAASDEIFEAPSEQEALNWIGTGGQAWLDERRRKRNG